MKWTKAVENTCEYNHKSGKKNVIKTFGPFEFVDSSKVKVKVRPDYSFMILSFNIIRSSWTPFSDVVKVTIHPQDSR